MDDLVEKLRACHMEQGEFGPVGYGPPINPDGHEAADRIEKLEAENAHQRELLACSIGFIPNDAGGVKQLRAQIGATLSDNRGGDKVSRAMRSFTRRSAALRAEPVALSQAKPAAAIARRSA